MDLRLFIKVLLRFRVLIAAGFAVAVLLTILSVATPSFSGGFGLKARKAEVWASSGQVLVTQTGFPEARADANTGADGAAPPAGADKNAPHFVDQARLVELSIIYARLARSDAVRQLIREGGPIRGATGVDVTNVTDLPMLEVLARATSREGAVALAQRQIDAMQTYLRRQQAANGVPSQDRLILKTVEKPGAPPLLGSDANNTWIIEPRSMMRPAVVFLALMGLVLGLAFVLENLRPRLRVLPDEQRTETLLRASGFPRS